MKRNLQISASLLCRFLAGSIMLLSIFCLAGCEQRELCYDHSHMSPVLIEFDWSQAPEATPNTMVVWFFSIVSGESYRFELTDDGSGVRSQFDSKIKVRPGRYRVLCHNGTTDHNSESGRSFDDYRIITDEDGVLSPMNRSDRAPLPGNAADEPVRSPARVVYAHTLDEEVTIEPSATEARHIRFTPSEVTTTYDIIITGVKNLREDTEASAVITGLAESWHPATSRPAGLEVTVPFKLDVAGADCLRGSVVTFGDAAPHDVRHFLRVYTSYKYYYDFDITDLMHKAGNSRHIEIRLNGIILPTDNQEGSGMSPGVNGWENAEIVDLPM